MSPILKIKNIADFAAVKAAEVNAELFSGYALRDELRKISKEYDIERSALSSAYLDPMHKFNKEIESSISGRSALEKNVCLANAATSAKSFDLFDSIGSAASKAMAECNSVCAAEKLSAFSTVNKELSAAATLRDESRRISEQYGIQKAALSSTYLDQIQNFNKDIESALSGGSALEKAVSLVNASVTAKSFGLLDSFSSISKAMSGHDYVSAAEKIVTLFSHRNNLNKLLEEASGTSALAKTIASLASLDIIKEVILPYATDAAMFRYEFKTPYEYPELERKFEEANTELANAQGKSDFIEIFKKLPVAIKIVFFFILMQTYDMTKGITINLITPSVASYVFNSNISKTQKINHIKNIPITMKNIDTTNLRFISGEHVYLRRSSSVDSNVLDITQFGQVVTVISKRKNWIEVEYKNENDEIMHGWVFTRYTKKFVK